MKNKTNYFFLAGLFFAVFVIVEFTEIYGNSDWFKAFLLMLSVIYLILGIANRQKQK
jgi:hypothetical protein